MSSIVSFVLRKKISAIWEWPNLARFTLNLALAFISGVVYGIGLGFGVDYLLEESSISKSQFIVFYSLFVSTACLLIDIFPFFKPPQTIFKPYHPVWLKDVTKLYIYECFMRGFWVFMFLMYGIMIGISNELYISDVLPSFLFALLVYLQNRIVRQLMFFRVKKSKFLFIIPFLTILVAFFLLWELGNSLLLSFLLLVMVGFCLVLSVYINYVKREKLLSNSGYYRKGLISRVLANKNMKILFWIYFVFKSFILLGNSLIYYKSDEYLFGSEWIAWFFISTLIIFTYIGYNFFGINRNLFFTHAIRENHTKGLLMVFSKSIGVLLLIDLIIVSILVIPAGFFSVELLSFYFVSFFLFFSTAFILSLYIPVVKEKYYSLDFAKYGSKTISNTATFTSFGIVGICILLSMNKYAFIFHTLLVIASISLLQGYPINLSKISHGFYSKMRKMK